MPYEEISYDLNLVGVTDIFLDDYAWYGYVVSGVSIRTDAGTGTLDFRINNSNIGGINGLTASTSGALYYATSSNTVSTGGQLKITVTGNSGATRLFGSTKIYRT